MSKTILVTGGTGTTGHYIIRELQKRGYQVRALARSTSIPKLESLNVEIAPGDLADADSLRQAAAQGVQGIIHAACTFTQPEIDQTAMAALLEAWGTSPFVFISSVDAYGHPQYLPLDEAHPLNPTTEYYGKAKVYCETQLQTIAQQQQRNDWSILRPPHVWAPHPSCYTKLTQQYPAIWNNETITLANSTTPEQTPGDGWIDARELAWAAVECLDRPLTAAANIINSHFTWQEFFKTLIQLTGSTSEIQFSAEVNAFSKIGWLYNGDRLSEHLGFEPQHHWQDTLAEIQNNHKSSL